MNPCRILIVEDEVIVAMDIQNRLAAMGYELAGRATNGEQALIMAEQQRPSLVLMDIRLHGAMDGIAAAEEIHRRFHVPVIFLTAYSEDSTLERAKLAEPFGYILKPFDARELKSTIEIALYRHQAEEEILRLNRLYNVLSQVNQAVVRSRSRDELLSTVCRVVVERGEIDLAWIGRLDPKTSGIIPVAHFGIKGDILSDSAFCACDCSKGQDCPCRAIRGGKPFVCHGCDSGRCFYSPEHAPAQLGFQSCGSFPLRFQGQVYGNLNLCVTQPGFFREREIGLLEEVAMDISFALDKIESDAQRERLGEQFKRQSTFLQTLMDAMPYPVFYKDAQLRYLGCNKAFEDFTGVKREQIIGKSVYALWPQDLADLYNRTDQELLMSTGPQPLIYEGAMESSAGLRNDMLFHKAVFLNPDGGVGGIIGAMEDITDRKRAEDLIRIRLSILEFAASHSLEELLQKTVDEVGALTKSPIGFYHFVARDQKTLSLQAWSTQTTKEFCKTEGKGLHYSIDKAGVWVDCIHERKPVIHNDYSSLSHRKGLPEGHAPIIRELVVPIVRTDQVVAILGIGNKPSNYNDKDVEVVSYLADVAWEITERKRAEEERSRVEIQLRQAQKMEALGTLAGGIAHDFNNILGIIMGYTEMSKYETSENSSLRKNLQQVLKATDRAKELVRQILAFSRKTEQQKIPVQLGLILKEALKILRPSLPSTIQITSDVVTKGAVLADPTQMHQVLMNLCANAAHAMQDKGGMLEVRLTDVLLGVEAIAAGLQPGRYLKLTVKDTGHGINPTIIGSIFDPFFTTKEPGAGTGLGLAVVHGIVQSHGGHIDVESLPGEGTSFTVLLPACEDCASITVEAATPLPHGQERVLVVDDEPALAVIVAQMLKRLGYEVDYRTNSIEALAAFRRQPDDNRFNLVITDMTMPHLTGADLAGELLREQANIPIILLTGFSQKIDAERARNLGIQGFLMKPVVFEELARVVREVLDQRAESMRKLE